MYYIKDEHCHIKFEIYLFDILLPVVTIFDIFLLMCEQFPPSRFTSEVDLFIDLFFCKFCLFFQQRRTICN